MKGTFVAKVLTDGESFLSLSFFLSLPPSLSLILLLFSFRPIFLIVFGKNGGRVLFVTHLPSKKKKKDEEKQKEKKKEKKFVSFFEQDPFRAEQNEGWTSIKESEDRSPFFSV